MYGIFPSQFMQHYHHIVEYNDVPLQGAILLQLILFIPGNVFVINWSILINLKLLKFQEAV